MSYFEDNMPNTIESVKAVGRGGIYAAQGVKKTASGIRELVNKVTNGTKKSKKLDIYNFDELAAQTQEVPVEQVPQNPEELVPQYGNDPVYLQEDVNTSVVGNYISKPEVISAIQYLGENAPNVAQFCTDGKYKVEILDDGTLKLVASDKNEVIEEGDYVARLKSVISVYKPEEFIEKYNAISQNPLPTAEVSTQEVPVPQPVQQAQPVPEQTMQAQPVQQAQAVPAQFSFTKKMLGLQKYVDNKIFCETPSTEAVGGSEMTELLTELSNKFDKIKKIMGVRSELRLKSLTDGFEPQMQITPEEVQTPINYNINK